MSKRLYFIIPFLILALIFGFGPACGEIPVETEKVEEAEEVIEEEVVEEEIVEEPIEEIIDLTQNFDGIEIKCIRVIDGDTIEVKDEAGAKYKIRYIGIDTPEATEDYGDIATEKNKELVEGKVVKLEKDVSSTDKYGRILAYVYVGDIFINAYLVQEGYAQISTYPPDVKYADYFLELQQEAKENNKGLWGIEIVEEEKEQEEEPVVEEPAEETQPPEEEEETIAPASEGQYCGSIKSDVYHYPTCSSAKQINPENLIWFVDENDAKAKGYRPCKRCDPPG